MMVFNIGYRGKLVMVEMIKTKSIYALKEEDDGIRILITRYWPRGIKKEFFDRWCKELSPSKNLLKRYKANIIDFQSFERLFLQEIEKSNINEICKQIAKEIIKGGNVTFLCYEKDESNCHRKYIKNICNQELLKLKTK